MTYIPGGGSGGGSISTAGDVALNNPANEEVLTYDTSIAKWINAPAAASSSVTVETLPAGTTLTIHKTGGVWPARPTDRADITVQWKGPDPSPAIVSSGTGGMLDNVDIRLVTP